MKKGPDEALFFQRKDTAKTVQLGDATLPNA